MLKKYQRWIFILLIALIVGFNKYFGKIQKIPTLTSFFGYSSKNSSQNPSTFDIENISKNRGNQIWMKNGIPTVPALSADGRFLVLSAGASRIRHGMSLTFTRVSPSLVQASLPSDIKYNPTSVRDASLWCFFDDGSTTLAYIYDDDAKEGPFSFLDCELNDFGKRELWQLHQILRVHLIWKNQTSEIVPILKAFISVPIPSHRKPNEEQLSLTLCTAPLGDLSRHLVEWIEFHRMVGFTKFVIYNVTDMYGGLSSIMNNYARKFPHSVDVIQWNFDSLRIHDPSGRRSFQIEALHDCLIRYGDQSEWMASIDLDEYFVPLPPFDTVEQYLRERYRFNAMGSVVLRSLFFCSRKKNALGQEEPTNDKLVIEKYTVRAKTLLTVGREKFLYRPRFVQTLFIHHLRNGLSQKVIEHIDEIEMAHYISMVIRRAMGSCDTNDTIIDTTIKDRFSTRLKSAISQLTSEPRS